MECDWKPKVCSTCNTFQHSEKDCLKQPQVKQVWVVKWPADQASNGNELGTASTPGAGTHIAIVTSCDDKDQSRKNNFTRVVHRKNGKESSTPQPRKQPAIKSGNNSNRFQSLDNLPNFGMDDDLEDNALDAIDTVVDAYIWCKDGIEQQTNVDDGPVLDIIHEQLWASYLQLFWSKSVR